MRTAPLLRHLMMHTSRLLLWTMALHVGVQAQSALPSPPASPAPVVSHEYDALGQPTRSVQAPNVAGFGFATLATYDTLRRPLAITDAMGGITRLDHDGADRLVEVTDPRGLLTRYRRSGLGEVLQLDSPDTGTAVLAYDAAGRLSTRLDSRGVLASYSYDTLGRPTSLVYTQGTQSALAYGWSYDQTGAGFSYGIGRLTSTQFPGGSARYAYDALGRVVAVTQTMGTLSLTTAYTWDGGGHLTRLTYPSGRVLVIDHAQGLPTALSVAAQASGTPQPLLSAIRHEPFGPVVGWTWHMAQGLQAHERTFDLTGRMVRHPLGAALRDLTYDAAGRLVSFTHLDAASGTATPPAQALDQHFGYDALGRLTSITTATANLSIAYDANGNRTGVTLNGVGRPYTTAAASNRLLAVANPARSFAHDPAGNTVADSAGYAATYGLDNRLATLSRAGTTAAYGYDALGLRVRKQLGATVTHFAYDLAGHLLGEYDAAGQALHEYVWLGDIPVAVLGPSADGGGDPAVYFVHTDHLDTPRLVMDRQGNRRWRWLSEPFGTTAAEEDPDALGAFTMPLRFPGQYFDQESGLHYNWHRDYDASVGRYVQSDPAGLKGGTNTYAYAENKPTIYMDPKGLWSIEIGVFSGWGFSTTFGYDESAGRGFGAFQFGYGLGGGVMFDRNGGLPPGLIPACSKNGKSYIGVIGKAGFGMPFVSGDIFTLAAGVGTTPGGRYAGVDWGGSGIGTSFGFSVGASAGVQLLFVDPPSPASKECTCLR